MNRQGDRNAGSFIGYTGSISVHVVFRYNNSFYSKMIKLWYHTKRYDTMQVRCFLYAKKATLFAVFLNCGRAASKNAIAAFAVSGAFASLNCKPQGQ